MTQRVRTRVALVGRERCSGQRRGCRASISLVIARIGTFAYQYTRDAVTMLNPMRSLVAISGCLLVTISGCVLALPSRAIQAQTASSCRSYDVDNAKALIAFAKATAGGADSEATETRSALGIPAVPVDSVTFVADSPMCASAALAYERAAQRDPTIMSTQRIVYVVKVGSSYLILDPDDHSSGEWQTVMVFDGGLTTRRSSFTM